MMVGGLNSKKQCTSVFNKNKFIQCAIHVSLMLILVKG